MKLFRVERLTRLKRRQYIEIIVFAVLAEDEASACEKAEALMPKDELDGPVVRWVAEEEETGIFRARTGSRRGQL